MNDLQKEQLIQDCLDGRLKDSGKRELFGLMREDGELLRLYCLSTAVDTSLTRFSSGQLSLRNAPQSIAEIANESRKFKSSRTAIIAAAAAIILGGIILRLILIPDQPAPLSFETAPGTILDLTHSGEISNQPTGNELAIGSQMTLTQGAVELSLENGVRAIVQAPADVTLKSLNQLYLNYGTAWFLVPDEGKGFQAITPHSKIVDFGTEFGVFSPEIGLDEVHLMEGKIEVTSRHSLKEQESLSGKTARRIDSAGRLKIIPLDESLFRKTLPIIHQLPIKWRAVENTILENPGISSAPILKASAKTGTRQELSLNGSFSQILLRYPGDRISVTGEVTFSGINGNPRNASLRFGLFQNEGSPFSPIWSGYRTTSAGPNHESHLRWYDRTTTPAPANSPGALLWKSPVGSAALQNDIIYHFSFSLTDTNQGILVESSFNDGEHEFAKSSYVHQSDNATRIFNSVAFSATEALSALQITFNKVAVNFTPSNGSPTK